MKHFKRLTVLLLVLAVCLSGVQAAVFAADVPETAPAEVTGGTVDAPVVLAERPRIPARWKRGDWRPGPTTPCPQTR